MTSQPGLGYMELSVLRPGRSWVKRDKLVTLTIENYAPVMKEEPYLLILVGSGHQNPQLMKKGKVEQCRAYYYLSK